MKTTQGLLTALLISSVVAGASHAETPIEFTSITTTEEGAIRLA